MQACRTGSTVPSDPKCWKKSTQLRNYQHQKNLKNKLKKQGYYQSTHLAGKCLANRSFILSGNGFVDWFVAWLF